MTEPLPTAPVADEPFVTGELFNRSEPVEGIVVLTYCTPWWQGSHYETLVVGRSGYAGPPRTSTNTVGASVTHEQQVEQVRLEYFDILRRAQSSWRTRFAARILAAAVREHLAEHGLPAGRRDAVLGLLVDAVRGAR